MCGILSYFGRSFDTSFEPVFQQALMRLIHRGPDADGVWMNGEKGIALGHRRLSILDLTDAGKQPMLSHNGRWIITYNGEIYNFYDLKKELESLGLVFKTRTDTEILLEGISVWGIEKTLQKTVGMFAFAVWDQERGEFFIARDRFGEKPCYVAHTAQGWLVASELKAITAFPFFEPKIDPDSLQAFLAYKYIPEPQTIYQSVQKLQPGNYAHLTREGEMMQRPYWSFLAVAEEGVSRPGEMTDEEAVTQLDYLLQQAVAGQKISDVPIGAFLSGGIDSSLTVAIMQQIEGKPVHTFSIGFEEKDYDESVHARNVAAHLHTYHTELIVMPKETQSIIPELCGIYDEPYADSSAIPTILVSRLARQQVTVCLSGDAGDEIFGGYTRYRHVEAQWRRMKHYPWVVRQMARGGFSLGQWMAGMMNYPIAYHRFTLRTRYAQVGSFADAYHGHMNHFHVLDDYLSVSRNRKEASTVPDWFPPYPFAMATDTLQYLPSDILTKVDRAAMAVSLETRVPFLDHRIVEWAWTVPMDLKIDAQTGKKILRKLLYRYVPQELLDRPKQGFGIPVGRWIRHELLDWAEALLSESSLRQTNVFHVKRIRGLWEAHRDGQVDDTYNLWAVLMLQAWLTEHRLSL
ncbi:MAG: asparagine synthase (glutamine-hydrolyzing) [bacterium]|jgi:asparagine synthase (glutamine-hydrolysing)|nr:asparagine synthase (glutamine-hydrolyzing) [bacterium]